MKYKAIIFDFFGVVGSDIYIDWINKNNLSHLVEELKNNYFKKSDLGLVSTAELHEHLAGLVNKPVEGVELEIKNSLIINQEVITFIKSIKPECKIVLCSNAPSGVVEGFLKEFNLESLFDEIVISSKVGVRKPDEAIFQKILDLVGGGPDEIVLIDDTLENIESAKHFGMKTVLFKDGCEIEKELSEPVM